MGDLLLSNSLPSTATLFPKALTRDSLSQPGLAMRRSGRLRRSTLVTLRWTAIAGQTIALVIVAQILGYDIPALPCAVLIAVSILLNLAVTFALPLDRRVSNLEAGVQLGFDLTQLSILLWLTGGMSNPFALLFIGPVVTSAATLSRRVVIVLGVLAAALSLFLTFNSLPLPWDPKGGFTLPFIYAFGFWTALMVGIIFTLAYTWQAASDARRMSDALAATEAMLAQEQRLAAIGGFAAAAAHELGTPLATIQLTAKEMARELERGKYKKAVMQEDAELLISQTQRCREILKQLSSRGDAGDMMHDELTLDALLSEAAEPFFGLGTKIDIEIGGEGEEPTLRRQSEIIYGLKNYIENAVGFADSKVMLKADWTAEGISIRIEDDGPGFDPSVRARLGEPYVSGRGERGFMAGGDEMDKAGGMGLGFFIAKTLIERTGGRVKFTNRDKAGGAIVTLDWPLERIAA
ncbi:MAG: ActS/PrrB/RegB family redox-sensitive histidine kinase [Maricaulaceae bacterium]